MRKKTICAMMTGFLAVQGIEVHAAILIANSFVLLIINRYSTYAGTIL